MIQEFPRGISKSRTNTRKPPWSDEPAYENHPRNLTDRHDNTIAPSVWRFASSPQTLKNKRLFSLPLNHHYHQKYHKQTILTMVRYLKNMDEYNTVLETSKSKLVVIDFTASWWVTRSVDVGLSCGIVLVGMDPSHNTCAIVFLSLLEQYTGVDLANTLGPSLKRWRRKTPKRNLSR